MSSIAYVCDDAMVEYHRLSQHKEILFWRISGKRKFSDFHIGDLLFFYVKTNVIKKRTIVGYGHFKEMQKLSLRQMWHQYEQKTGYHSFLNLKKAIQKVVKDKIPDKMNCLVLDNVVFFARPITLQEVNLYFPKSLESFAYIDHQNPCATTEILKIAAQEGINIWANVHNFDAKEIFLQDAIEQKFLSLTRKYPNQLSKRIYKEQIQQIEQVKDWKKNTDFQYYFSNYKRLEIRTYNFHFGQQATKEIELFIGRWMCILSELKESYNDLEICFSLLGKENKLTEIVKKVFK